MVAGDPPLAGARLDLRPSECSSTRSVTIGRADRIGDLNPRRRGPDDASASQLGEGDPVAREARRAAADQAKRLRIEDVLLDDHPAGEALRRVARHHRNGGLRHDRPGVELRHHEMHRAAMDENAFRKRPLVGMRAAEEGQKGRVDVEHPSGPAFDEPGRQHPHEARKAQELDAALGEGGVERLLEASRVA